MAPNTLDGNLHSFEIEQIERDAKKHLQLSTNVAQKEAEQLQGELTDLLRIAREKHKKLEEEQQRFLETQQSNLEDLIAQARIRQKEEHEVQLKELESRRKQIEQLNQRAKDKLNELPQEQIGTARLELNELIRKGLENQRHLETEQRKAADKAKKELAHVVKDAHAAQVILQKKHIQEMKQELSLIAAQVATQVDKVKVSFENLYQKEKNELSSIFYESQKKYVQKRIEAKRKLEETELYIKQQQEIIIKKVHEGEPDEARKLHSEMIHKMNFEYRSMKLEADALAEKARVEIAKIDKEAKDTLRQQQKLYEAQFNEAKMLLKEHSSQHLKRIELEIADQVKSDLDLLRSSGLTEKSMIHADQISAMRMIQADMQRGANDKRQERFQSQYEIVQNASKLISEMEKTYKSSTEKIQEDQQGMIEKTARRLREVEEAGRGYHKQKKDMQLMQMNNDFRNTSKIIMDLEREKKAEQEEIYRIKLDEKIRIGKEASKAKQQADEEISYSARKTRQAIAQLTQQIRDRMQVLEEEQRLITDASKQQISRITQQMRQKEELAEVEYKINQDKEKEDFRLMLQEITTKEEKIADNQEHIDDLVSKAKANQYAQMKRKTTQMTKEELDELLGLIAEAQQKQDRLSAEMKATKEKLYRDHETALHEMKEAHKQRRITIIKEYESQLNELEAESEPKIQLIKHEQRLLAGQREKDILEMSDEAESVRQLYKKEQQRIIAEAQKRLRNLAGDAATSATSPS